MPELSETDGTGSSLQRLCSKAGAPKCRKSMAIRLKSNLEDCNIDAIASRQAKLRKSKEISACAEPETSRDASGREDSLKSKGEPIAATSSTKGWRPRRRVRSASVKLPVHMQPRDGGRLPSAPKFKIAAAGPRRARLRGGSMDPKCRRSDTKGLGPERCKPPMDEAGSLQAELRSVGKVPNSAKSGVEVGKSGLPLPEDGKIAPARARFRRGSGASPR